MSKTLVQLIQERTGISEQQAGQAVDVVVDFLKQRLPAPLAGQVDGLVKGDITQVEGMLGNIGSLGGFFGKKE